MIYLHHEHSHCHAHTHDGVEHTHEHSHVHDHEHGETAHTHDAHDHGEHTHSHDCTHECSSCGGCDPMAETVALMQYMVNHNAAHARELAALADQLEKLGNKTASEQVRSAVGEFEKGNMRLSVVLSSLK